MKKHSINQYQRGVRCCHSSLLGGPVALWLVPSFPDRAVRVRPLAGETVFCSLARHLTLTVPLSTQEYKWEPGET